MMAVLEYKCCNTRAFNLDVGNNESQTKKYVTDSERDAHIGRHMNMFASGFYEPPLALSLPLAIERIKLETSNELELLKKGQAQCRFVSPGSANEKYYTWPDSKITLVQRAC